MGLEEEVEEEEVVVEVCTDIKVNLLRLSHHCHLGELAFIFTGFRNNFEYLYTILQWNSSNQTE